MTRQPSLFGRSETGDDQRIACFRPYFAAWQAEARRHLRADRSPEQIWWQPAADARIDPEAPPASAGTTRATVPRAFIAQARAASCHVAEDRWALLYSVLWRLTHGERHLLSLGGDPDIVRLTRYMKAVRRDVHKMKAFVRFRAVADDDDPNGEPRYVAWFEPDHFIVEYAAGFFKRRFANMRWSILTPLGCAHWEGEGEVWFSPGTDKTSAPAGDALDDAWHVYYRHIFNPARVKVRAMQSEMPQKYWKNMPEAHLIPGLLREANARVAGMEAARAREDVLHCGTRPETPDAVRERAVARAVPDSLARRELQARGCRQCPLWQSATQTVFGEGPADARVVIVGEQPGDREDLAGRPFVGPAGQLLDRALAAAGIARDQVYLTNAVKHFKFRARGKTRLHSTPGEQEITACRPWLESELELIDPTLVIGLGVTAGRALLGPQIRVKRDRGRRIEHEGRGYLLTVHPAYLLRCGGDRAGAAEFQRFVADLSRALPAMTA